MDEIWKAYDELIEHPIPGAYLEDGTRGPDFERYRLMLDIYFYRAAMIETPALAVRYSSKLSAAEAELSSLTNAMIANEENDPRTEAEKAQDDLAKDEAYTKEINRP